MPGVEGETFVDLRDAWNALVDQSGGAVFQRHEWLAAWMQAEPVPPRLFLVVARAAGAVTAIAPLQWSDRRQGPLRFRHLQPLGAPATGYNDLLPAGPAAVGPMIEAVLGQSRRWDVMELGPLPAESPTLAALRLELQRRRLPWHERTRPAPYLSLTDGFTPSRPLRYHLRRGRTRLERRGEVSYHVLTDPAQAMAALPDFTEMLRRRGREAPDFLAALLTGPAQPLVHFSRLCVNERAVAYHFGFQDRRRLYGYILAFDSDYADCMPGKLLIERLVAATQAAGIAELDFLIGEQTYKIQWAKSLRQMVDVQVFPAHARLARLWYATVKPRIQRLRGIY